MLTADMPLVERLRKQASVIHIAAEKTCADDVSDALRKAADKIEGLRGELKRSTDSLELLIAEVSDPGTEALAALHTGRAALKD